MRSILVLLPFFSGASASCFHEGNLELIDGNAPTFGVKSTSQTDLQCLWRIPPNDEGASTTLVIEALSLELGRDALVMSSGGNTFRLEGDYLTPATFAFPVAATGLHLAWTSDPSLADTNRTRPASLRATFFSSANGTCWSSCSQRGTCAGGVCACDAGWVGGDCSTAAPVLKPDVPIELSGVAEGEVRYFTVDATAQLTNALVEFDDSGHADSSPLLLLGLLPPRMNPQTVIQQDLTAWAYDSSDLHHLRAVLPRGTYYVGVTNARRPDKAAGGQAPLEPVGGTVVLRARPDGKLSCLNDCYGHGTCDPTTGSCACDEGFAGHHPGGLETCEYAVQPLSVDRVVNGSLRVGDWAYFSLDISEAQARRRSVMLHLVSASPLAHGALAVQHGRVPSTRPGFAPNAGGLDAAWVDHEGFSILNGRQQTIVIEPKQLSAGTYYVGVFNLWGFTGLADASAGPLDFALYSNVYAMGRPCPMNDEMLFCNGDVCDQTTGTCECSIDRVGPACQFEAARLAAGGTMNGTLEVGEEAHFYVEVLGTHTGSNLVIEATRSDGNAKFFLLAQKGAAPSLAAHSHDEHDLQGMFLGAATQKLTVDRYELTTGTWYVKLVHHLLSPAEALSYTLQMSFEAHVDCPTATGSACSGHGQCDRETGRCACHEGWVLGSCEARGVFSGLELDGSSDVPALAEGGWAYWSLPLGCKGLGLDVGLHAHDLRSSPALVIRRGALPLMLAESADFFDHFRGITHEGHAQRVIVEPCAERSVAAAGSCKSTVLPTVMANRSGLPGSLMVDWEVPPDVYYIGVYNDVQLARGPLINYTLEARVIGTCDRGSCANGFLGDRCELACPGLANPFSTASVPSLGSVCNDRGACSEKEGAAKCECYHGFVGSACQLACPLTESGVCGGRGACVEARGQAQCECPPGTEGTDCSSTADKKDARTNVSDNNTTSASISTAQVGVPIAITACFFAAVGLGAAAYFYMKRRKALGYRLPDEDAFSGSDIEALKLVIEKGPSAKARKKPRAESTDVDNDSHSPEDSVGSYESSASV